MEASAEAARRDVDVELELGRQGGVSVAAAAGALSALSSVVGVATPLAVAAALCAALAAALAWRWLAARERAEWRRVRGGLARPLCLTERAYTRWARDYFGGDKVGVLVSVQGRALRLADLQRAARKLEARHPMVRASLSDWRTVACPDAPTAPVFVVRASERTGDDSWRAVWEHIEQGGLSLGQGFFEADLIHEEGGAERAELLVTGQHLACDADSLMALAHELLGLLAEPGKELPARQPVLPETTAVLREIPSFWRDRLLGNLRFLGTVVYVSAMCVGVRPSPSAKADAGLRVPTLHSHTLLTAEETAAVAAAARQRGLTVNAAVMGALVHATAEVNAATDSSMAARASTVALNVTVNLRKRYTHAAYESADVANHACAAYVTASADPAERAAADLWKSAAQTSKSVSDELPFRRLTPAVMWNELLWRIIPSMRNQHLGNSVVVVGNWGKTPFPERYGGADGAASIAVLSMRPLINFNIFNCCYAGFSTTHGCLQISTIGARRVFTQTQIATLGGKVKTHLLNMAK
jgi:hypothetical protein